jgi:hypothetical protein
VDLFNHGSPLWSLATCNGSLDYKISPLSEKRFRLLVKDGDSVFPHGKIEIVNNERIRIYVFKHHGILDVADEYQKTKDLDSYDQIMQVILQEPEQPGC